MIIIFKWDSLGWNGIYDSLIQLSLIKWDGVLLLFDISSRDDFNGLNYCLSLITYYLELEDFPVLLIAKK